LKADFRTIVSEAATQKTTILITALSVMVSHSVKAF